MTALGYISDMEAIIISCQSVIEYDGTAALKLTEK
jgi:hypothetical protein